MGLARRRFGWGFRNIEPSAGGVPGLGKALATGQPAAIPGRKVSPPLLFQSFKLRDLFRARKLGEQVSSQATPEAPGQTSFFKQLTALFTPGTRVSWWVPTRSMRSIRKSEGGPSVS